MYTNESYYLMPHNSRADMVCLLDERYDTKFDVNLVGFRSQSQESYVSSHTERVVIQRNSLSVDDCLYVYIYIYSLKSAYLGSKLLFKQVLLKTMELFITLDFFFTRLLVIFPVSGSRW